MRCLRCALLLGALGGCSLVYDPGKLPSLPPDAALPPDANPDNLGLDRLEPAALLEGYGDGGGRLGLLMIYGHDLAPSAEVTITAVDGGTIPRSSSARRWWIGRAAASRCR